MATVREKIVDLVASKLADVTTGNGFAVDVVKVFRSQKEAINVNEHPSLILDDLGDERRWHIRLGYESRMRLSVQVVEHDYEEGVGPTETALVLGEVERQVVANEFWNDTVEDLAVATLIERNGPSLGEPEKPTATDRLDVTIVYRTEQDDPDTVRLI